MNSLQAIYTVYEKAAFDLYPTSSSWQGAVAPIPIDLI